MLYYVCTKFVGRYIVAKRWTYREDYIVCKYVDEHDVFISNQDKYELMLVLKGHGYDRSLEAVGKRVFDYQLLLTKRDSNYANEQERRISELFIADSNMSRAQRWIDRYIDEIYFGDDLCDEEDMIDSSMAFSNNVANQTSQYLAIDTPMVNKSFYEVFDELLKQYFENHKDEKKTDGKIKKEFKDALEKDYAVPINTFNAIRREKYDTVSRKVLFRLCFALELNYEDAKKLLESVGYDFRRNVKSEVVIESILKCDNPRRFIIGEIDATLERHKCSRLFT